MATQKPVDTLTELIFPLSGENQGNEFQEQPNATTAEALNVRARDIETRDRGGSRPGLVRFIDAPVFELGAEVQLLGLVVTTGIAALSGNYEVPTERIDVDYILDPSDGDRNPGWAVPIGGSGIQPNRNLPNVTDEEEDEPKFATVSTGGFVTLIPSGNSILADPVAGSTPPVGTKVLVVKSGADFVYQPAQWV